MVDRSDAVAFMGKTFEEAARLRALHAGSSPEDAAELARAAALAAAKAKQRLAEMRAQKVDWVANKRFEITKLKFKFPKARTYEMIGLVLGCIEAKFWK